MSIKEINGREVITQTKADPLTFKAGQEVYLLDGDGNVIGNADLFATRGKFPVTFHTHSLNDWGENHAGEGEHYVVVRCLSILPHAMDMPYPYVMAGVEVPEKMGDLQSKQNYIWDLNKLDFLAKDRPFDPLEGIDFESVLEQQPQPSDLSEPAEPAEPAQSSQPSQPSQQSQPAQSALSGKPSHPVHQSEHFQQGQPSKPAAKSQEAQPPQPSQPSVSQLPELENPEMRELVELDEEEPNEVVCIDSSEEGVVDQSSDVELQHDDSSALEVVPFNATLYQQTRVLINLDNIEVPPNTARDLDPSHAASISRDLVRYGTVGNIGDMAVVAKDTPKDFNPLDSDFIAFPVYITDGRHRRRAYELARDKSPQWEEACERLSVSIWTRVDRQPISFLELLAISTFLNQQTGNVRPITFKDTIYTSVSACKIVMGSGDGVNTNIGLTLTAFVDHLLKSKALGNKKKKQVRRYAQIALRLARSERSYQVFMDTCSRCEKLGVVHVASDTLFRQDDDGFELALLCLEKRILSNKVGKFEDIRRIFFERVEELYDGVKEAADRHQQSVKDILDAKIPITRNITMLVKERIWREMVTFQSSGTAKVKKEPKFSKGKEVIFKAIDNVFTEIDVEEQGDRREDNVVTPTAPDISRGQPAANNELNENEVRRSTRLAGQEDHPILSYREPGAAVKTKKKKTRAVRRKTTQALQKRDIISALKKTSKQELKSILQSLNLNVVETERAGTDREGDEDSIQQEVEQEEEEEEDEDNVEFLHAESDFQDDIVGIPFGYTLPRRYEGPIRPSWCRYANIIPSRWPSMNPICAVEPWLRRIHIPDQHRANIVVRDTEVLRRNHSIIYWRAAFNYLRVQAMEDFPIDQDHFKDVSGDDLRWAAAVTHDDVASTYFWEKKEELNNVGFTVLEGFVEDHKNPDKIGTFKFPVMYNGDKNVFTKLREFMLGSFPTEKDLSEGNDRSEWNTIVNSGHEQDTEMTKKGIGRFTSTHRMVTKGMETKENVWACVNRALLDVRVGSAVAALRLYDNSKDRETYVFTPKTGGRWLMTSKGCERQQVHTDFPSLTAQQLLFGAACPGYFTITTGEQEVPLWVCKSSHNFVAYGYDTKDGEEVRKVMIPPFSIAIGRGDVLHAGASFEDSKTKDSCLRYHMYFVPDTFKLPDGVFLDHSLKITYVDDHGPTVASAEEEEIEEAPINRKRKRTNASRNDHPHKKARSDDAPDDDDNENIMKEVFGEDIE